MKSVYLALIAFIALSLTLGCGRIGGTKAGDDPGPAPASEFSADDSSAGILFNKARKSLNRGQFLTAIEEYESLEANFPFGDHAAQARLDVGYAYYQQGEHDNAIATLDRFLKLYPQSEKTDYAYYLKGLSNFSRGKSLLESVVPRKLPQLDQAWLREAASDFSTLEQKYPESTFVEDAKTRRGLLLNNMAKHELETANYYFGRSAMVATINRVNYMLEQFPESSSSAEGLALLVKAHRALGNTQSAEEAIALLRANHPEFTKKI